jgi:dephospho-CoA kinase
MKRDGILRDEVLARLSRQLSLEEKKRYADFVIDTSGSKEEAVRQVQQVYGVLKGIAEAAGR